MVVMNGLDVMYQDAECELKSNTPFETLVAVILSAQCTDKRVNMEPTRVNSLFQFFDWHGRKIFWLIVSFEKFLCQDFLLAMEHGMPPISGLGFGIDRFLQFVFDCPNIRDVVLFLSTCNNLENINNSVIFIIASSKWL